MTMDITKKGCHRELVYGVQYHPGPHDVKAVLVHRLPKGIYVDAYQLASLRTDTDLQALLEAEVDLEAPAYVSPDFVILVYPALDSGRPGYLQATVPIHCRYHRPTHIGSGWEKVTVKPPRLLLQSELCENIHPLPPHTVVDAPCTVNNQSMCSWLEIHTLQTTVPVSLEIPVGNFSAMVPVCAGTLFITLLCWSLLLGTVWKHGIFQPL